MVLSNRALGYHVQDYVQSVALQKYPSTTQLSRHCIHKHLLEIYVRDLKTCPHRNLYLDINSIFVHS